MDHLKKELYKDARKKGYSKKDALLKAGYPISSASHKQNTCPVAIVGERELLAEYMKLATKDNVIGNLLKEASNPANKASDRIRAWELIGKYLQLFREEGKTGIAIFNNINDLQKDIEVLYNKRLSPNKDSVLATDKCSEIPCSHKTEVPSTPAQGANDVTPRI